MLRYDKKPFDCNRMLDYRDGAFLYSVISEHLHDKGQAYTLKRFSLLDPEALQKAKKELKVYKKLFSGEYYVKTLPILFYAFTIHNAPTLVYSQSSGVYLDELVRLSGPLNVHHARIYLVETMSALEFLHDKNIVHLHCRPCNIAISWLGHVLLTNFTRAYDLRKTIPDESDFPTGLMHSAPEIVTKMAITPQADVWSLGVLMAFLIDRKMRYRGSRAKASLGIWSIARFSSLHNNLRKFFNAVFTYNYVNRPRIDALGKIDFFSDATINRAAWGYYQPPLYGRKLAELRRDLEMERNMQDSLAAAIYDRGIPVQKKGRFQYNTSDNNEVSVLMEESEPRELLEEELAKFNYIHPDLNAYRLYFEGQISDQYIERKEDVKLERVI